MSIMSPAASGTSVPESVVLSPMTPAHDGLVLALHAHVFGPGRFARTAFRLRERAATLYRYSLVAHENETLIGAVSLSRIGVGPTRGVLLGPLAMLQARREKGVGKALLHTSVAAAFAAGEPYVLLVGDLPYYAPAGFQVVPFGTMRMPGPVDPARLLVAHNPAGSVQLSGTVQGLER